MWKNRELKSVGATLAICAASAVACGPDFPNRLLDNGDAAVVQAPVATFAQEVARLAPSHAVLFKSQRLPDRELPYRDAVKRLDLKEVEEAAVFSQAEFAAYRQAREYIFKYDKALAAGITRENGVPRKPQVAFVAPVVPEGRGAAREFSAYLRGSLLWYQGQTNAAIGAWSALLDQPLDERRHRSTWAAFMLGKAYLGQRKFADAVTQFQSVRRLAREGLSDVLGLAASSYGWEARAELDRENVGRALALYLDQLATGEASVTNSLKFAATHAWTLPATQRVELVKQTPARRVLVAYALSQDESYFGPDAGAQKAFLAAIEAAGIPIMEEADRLAWAAYRAGDMQLAARFLVLAPRDSVMTQLVESKLLLRQGREKEAMDALANIVKSFPESPVMHERYAGFSSPVWEMHREPLGERLRAELGVLHLARNEFVQALDLLLRGGYWQDAAYVAERVLTAGELQAYVDKNWTAQSYAAVEEELKLSYRNAIGTPGENVRYVLGRRLVRDGKLEQARPYLPPTLRPVLDAYIRHQRVGHDAQAVRPPRAEALWKAACIARYAGMELMGTELDPDWAVYRGAFQEAALSTTRAKPDFAVQAKPSARELERAKQSAPTPNSRYHYRALALDLAWRAAQLMPDESAQTAEVLCTAGGWLKDFDRIGADRFYKALVKRCGQTTELGQQADKLHWFPDRKVDRKKLLHDATESR